MKRKLISLSLLLFIFITAFSITAAAYTYDLTEADTPEHAEYIVYGQSGTGRDLQAYRFGQGENVMVVGFAIHGYEDNFTQDGLCLVYTAELLMELLNENIDTVNNYGWSIYVLPCMNPDGLLDGTSMNGPGRCTTTYLDSSGNLIKDSGKGIDMNRSFPYGWVKKTDSRNFNGSAPLACLESQALAQFIEDVKGSGENICIDAHGWLSQIITSNGSSSTLYKTFKSAFPYNTYANCMNGAGYFTSYAGSIGYMACLFEFPSGIYSASAFQSSGYPEKFNQCILTLAEAYGTYREPEPEVEPEVEPEDNHAEECPSLNFTDLSADAWYHEAIDFTLQQGAFKGVSDACFGPDMPMTRAMLATVLYRMAAEPTVAAADFPDVEENMWYTNAIGWAQENGIVTGFDDGTFRPDQEITREQLVTMICRYAETCGLDVTGEADLTAFTDSHLVGDYAEDAMIWACENGIIRGSVVNGELRLSPLRGATRAEVAQVLFNYAENLSIEDDETILYSDQFSCDAEAFTPTDGPDLGGN